ncbi:Metal-dependent hydrolase YbeY, involved in rRNA and/or ribosome maturation and assembly [hydrothermal vent metagenome]|uniref:Metal-dependent hydrolase YbeY, involved in rRNA and/or ribosome maturation and assembly n=1 Tax=hydrothermal vent metagenome TaxID=652676 RepID=A0A1W1CR80_9ZZZZ
MLNIQKTITLDIDEIKIHHWVETVLINRNKQNSEITLRFVDIVEIQQLNHTYRNKNQPTNVLSFPSDLPSEIKSNFLGDIVICNEVVIKEAKQQQKTNEAHFAHMIIHGVLHLLGFDHIKEAEAEEMENLEIELLKQLNFQNPY